MENYKERYFTVGELADKVGITVRTLQYYDKTGLLKSTLSEGGRRMYTRDDILKLQQIMFLKSFGFPLDEIKNKILNYKTSTDFKQIFTQQREILLGQISNFNNIVKLLDTVIDETKTGKEISLDRLMAIMGSMKQGNPYSFVIRYLGEGQLKSVIQRFNSDEKNNFSMDQMKELFAQLVNLDRNGVDPTGKEGQELAENWWNMVTKFTGGDQNLLETLFSTGRDMDNWPQETKELQDAMEHFLSEALSVYLHHNGIQIPNKEADYHD